MFYVTELSKEVLDLERTVKHVQKASVMDTEVYHRLVVHVPAMLGIMELTVLTIVSVMKHVQAMETALAGVDVFVMKVMLVIDAAINVIPTVVAVDMDNVALQASAYVILATMEINVNINVPVMVHALEIPANVIRVSLALIVTQNAQDMESAKSRHVYVHHCGKDPSVKLQDVPMIALEMEYAMVFFKNVSVILGGKELIAVCLIVVENLIAMVVVRVVSSTAQLYATIVQKAGWALHVMMYVLMECSRQWIAETANASRAGLERDAIHYAWVMVDASMTNVSVIPCKAGEVMYAKFQDVQVLRKIAQDMESVTVLLTLAHVMKVGRVLVVIYLIVQVHLIVLIAVTVMPRQALQLVNAVGVDGWVQLATTLVSLANKSQWTVVTVSVNLVTLELVVIASALNMARSLMVHAFV